MAAPSFREPRRGFELTSAKTIAVQELAASGSPTIAAIHGSDIHMFWPIQIPFLRPCLRPTKSCGKAKHPLLSPPPLSFAPSETRSLPPALQRSGRSSISAGVVVKPRLARAELARAARSGCWSGVDHLAAPQEWRHRLQQRFAGPIDAAVQNGMVRPPLIP